VHRHRAFRHLADTQTESLTSVPEPGKGAGNRKWFVEMWKMDDAEPLDETKFRLSGI
jgi:hypothetical protein